MFTVWMEKNDLQITPKEKAAIPQGSYTRAGIPSSKSR